VLRLIGRYVFREILTSAALGTLLATFVVFLFGLDKLFELLAHGGAATYKMVGMLFLCAIPPVLPLTIPFGVLVGILIGLGRMAADGEIIAMRANGVSSRKVVAPVLVFAALGMGAAAFASLRLTPLATREITRIGNELARTGLSAEILPRVFDEDFPNQILYVGDVRPGERVLWRPVFMANVTAPEKRTEGLQAQAIGPRITVAREAIAESDPANRRMQLTMHDAFTYEMAKGGEAHDASAPRLAMGLDAAPPREQSLTSKAMNTRQLIAYKAGPNLIENKIELHRRFALPVACIMLALVGIPLGIATRKGGRSAGYLNAVFLAFFCYWLSSIALTKFAQQGSLPAAVALWLPDAMFGLAGIVLVARMERPGDSDPTAALKSWASAMVLRLRKPKLTAQGRSPLSRVKMPLLPQILDAYILSQFIFYFGLLLTSFVSLTLVFNFVELANDMVRNHIVMSKMLTYLFFLSPELIYRTTPISVLVAVLVTFGVLSKQNEITAFKACGVSLFRLSLPILFGGLFLSTGLFAFEHYCVPAANRRQDELRDEIKGRPPQTYLRPDRKWIMGRGARIYYYRNFDAVDLPMSGVSVFELDPKTFRMVRQIGAESARWSRSLKMWVFEKGWKSDFSKTGRNYQTFETATFPEITEPPDYFLKAVLQDKQMNFQELDYYIRDLKQSGFDTVRLQVQYYRKFAVPLFALIMAMIAIPFGFMVGRRGAMTGIGVSIIIAIVYWSVSMFFETLGGVGQLPATVAAWSPDAIFGLLGTYLLLRMRS
jgi:LPS export ABC transporter permease LptG/LPS export ABC transporter permease LptF